MEAIAGALGLAAYGFAIWALAVLIVGVGLCRTALRRGADFEVHIEKMSTLRFKITHRDAAVGTMSDGSQSDRGHPRRAQLKKHSHAR